MKRIFKIGIGIMTTGMIVAAVVTPIIVLNNKITSSSFATFDDEIKAEKFIRNNNQKSTSTEKSNSSGTTYISKIGPIKISSDDDLLFGFDNLGEIANWIYKNVPMGPEQRTIQSITLNHGSVFENGVINLGGHSGKKKGFNISLSPVFLMEHNRIKQTIQQLSFLFFKNDDVKSIFGLSGDELAYRKMISPEAVENSADLIKPLENSLVLNLSERNNYSNMFNQLFEFLLTDSFFAGGSFNKGSSRIQMFKDLKSDLVNVTNDNERKELLKKLLTGPMESPMGMTVSLQDQLLASENMTDISDFISLIDKLSTAQLKGLCESFSSNKFISLIESSYQPFDLLDNFEPDGPNGIFGQWIFDLQSRDFSQTSKSTDILNYSEADGAFKFGDTSDVKKALDMLIKQYDISNQNLEYENRKKLLMSALALFITSRGAIFNDLPENMPDDIFVKNTNVDMISGEDIVTYDLSLDKVLNKVSSYVDENKGEIFSNLNAEKILDIIYSSLPFTKKRMEVLDEESRDTTGTLQEYLNNKYHDSFELQKNGDSLYRTMVRRSSYELLPIIAHEYGHHMTITHTTQAGVAINNDISQGTLTDKVMRSVETVSTSEEADLVNKDKYDLFQSSFPEELKNVIDKTSDNNDQTDIINNIARTIFKAKGYFNEMSTEILNGAGGQAYYDGEPLLNPTPLTLIYATANGKIIPSSSSLLDFYNTVSDNDWIDNNGNQEFSLYFPKVLNEAEIKPIYKVVFEMYVDMISEYKNNYNKEPEQISFQLINQYVAKKVHDNTHKMMEFFNQAITKNGKSFRDSNVFQFGSEIFNLLKASFEENGPTSGVINCFDKINGKLSIDDVVSQAEQYVNEKLDGFVLDKDELKNNLEKIWTVKIDGEEIDKTPFSIPDSPTNPVVTKFLLNSKDDYEYIGKTLTATPMYGTDFTAMSRYVFTYYESLTRIWQLLSLPYNRELLISPSEATNTDLARFAQFGIRFYDDNHEINQLGEKFVEMFSKFFDLDKKISLINRSPNDGKFTFSGHFSKEENYKGLLFMNKGKIIHEEDILKDVENIKYNQIEGDASSATNLSDKQSWMTKNMVIGDFENADLREGNYELAFWNDKNDDNVVQDSEIVYIKNSETSEDGEMNNNGYIDINAAIEGNPDHKSGDENFEIKVQGVLV